MSKLFYDDEYDALAQTITNSEHEFKAVAAFMFPHLKATSQYARLKNCLNAERHDERLTFGQVIAMCRFCGSFDALYFMADDLAHDRPLAKKPEDEMAALQREFIKSVQQQKQIADRIERISGAEPKLRGVA